MGKKKEKHNITIPKESILPVLREEIQKQIEEELFKLDNATIIDVTSVEWVAEGIEVSFTTE